MAVIGTVVNPDQASRHRKQCSRPNGERPVRWARSAQDLHRHTVQPAFVQAIRSSHVCGLTTSDRSATDAPSVPEPVRQHVVDGIDDFPDRFQHMHVEPLGKYLTAPAERGVQPLGHADGESLDAAGQRRLVIRFGDQVQVIALQRQLDDAKPIALAGRLERRQYRPIALPTAQAREAVYQTQRHVYRVMSRERRPFEVRHGTGLLSGSARSLARTTTTLVMQIEGKLSAPLH